MDGEKRRDSMRTWRYRIKWRCEPLSVPSMQQTKSTKQHKEHMQIIKQSGGQKNTRLQDLQWRKDIHKQQSMSMKKQEDKEAHTHTFYSKQRHSRNTMLFLVIFWFCEIPYIAQHWGFQLHQPPQLQNRQKKTHIFPGESVNGRFLLEFPTFSSNKSHILIHSSTSHCSSTWKPIHLAFCYLLFHVSPKMRCPYRMGPPVMWTLVGLQPHLN